MTRDNIIDFQSFTTVKLLLSVHVVMSHCRACMQSIIFGLEVMIIYSELYNVADSHPPLNVNIWLCTLK